MVDEDVNDHENGIYTGVMKDDGFVKRLVTGIVALVGSGRDHPDMWGIQIGDVVAYSPVGSRKFQIWGKPMTFIRLSSVAGVIE